VLPPGLAVTVHEPDGKPLNATDPVAVTQVGWVIVPITGAVGALTTVIVSVFELAVVLVTQPAEVVTVHVTVCPFVKEVEAYVFEALD
jgi:hypothetical protein